MNEARTNEILELLQHELDHLRMEVAALHEPQLLGNVKADAHTEASMTLATIMQAVHDMRRAIGDHKEASARIAYVQGRLTLPEHVIA